MSACTRHCKVVFLGDSGVGKTAIISRYLEGSYHGDLQPTIGANLETILITTSGEKIALQICDTAGQERFDSIIGSFFRGADVCVLVYDVTNRESFKHLQKWRDTFISKSGIQDIENFPFVIFANKSDLDSRRLVHRGSGETFGVNFLTELIEVSARTGANVDEGFRIVSEEYLASQRQKIVGLELDPGLDLDGRRGSSWSCCG